MASDDEQEISKLFEDKDADLILFGHNHRLHLFDDKSTIYFNPGAVGLNNELILYMVLLQLMNKAFLLNV